MNPSCPGHVLSLCPFLVLALSLVLVPSHGSWLTRFVQGLQVWAREVGWGKTAESGGVCSMARGVRRSAVVRWVHLCGQIQSWVLGFVKKKKKKQQQHGEILSIFIFSISWMSTLWCQNINPLVLLIWESHFWSSRSKVTGHLKCNFFSPH